MSRLNDVYAEVEVGFLIYTSTCTTRDTILFLSTTLRILRVVDWFVVSIVVSIVASCNTIDALHQ